MFKKEKCLKRGVTIGGMHGDEYLHQFINFFKENLLLDEVKAEDVAKAFFHLATSKKTTGAILTVDGGNIAASLR